MRINKITNIKILKQNLKSNAIINLRHPIMLDCKCYSCLNKWYPIYNKGSIIHYSPQTYIHRIENKIETILCPVCGYYKIRLDILIIKKD